MRKVTGVLLMALLAFIAGAGCDNGCNGDDPPPVQKYTLLYNVEGLGAVLLDPDGGLYEAGTMVQVSALDTTADYTFDRFEGDITSRHRQVVVTMDDHKEFTAHFRRVDPPSDIELSVPEWVVTSRQRSVPYVTGSEFSITEDGVYKLSANLEYSAESKNQEDEDSFFRIGTGSAEIKPSDPNATGGDLVVYDLNENEEEVVIWRHAGLFELSVGDYFIAAYHGAELDPEEYSGAQSVHGFDFKLEWQQASVRKVIEPLEKPPKRTRIR